MQQPKKFKRPPSALLQDAPTEEVKKEVVTPAATPSPARQQATNNSTAAQGPVQPQQNNVVTATNTPAQPLPDTIAAPPDPVMTFMQQPDAAKTLARGNNMGSLGPAGRKMYEDAIKNNPGISHEDENRVLEMAKQADTIDTYKAAVKTVGAIAGTTAAFYGGNKAIKAIRDHYRTPAVDVPVEAPVNTPAAATPATPATVAAPAATTAPAVTGPASDGVRPRVVDDLTDIDPFKFPVEEFSGPASRRGANYVHTTADEVRNATWRHFNNPASATFPGLPAGQTALPSNPTSRGLLPAIGGTTGAAPSAAIPPAVRLQHPALKNLNIPAGGDMGDFVMQRVREFESIRNADIATKKAFVDAVKEAGGTSNFVMNRWKDMASRGVNKMAASAMLAAVPWDDVLDIGSIAASVYNYGDFPWNVEQSLDQQTALELYEKAVRDGRIRPDGSPIQTIGPARPEHEQQQINRMYRNRPSQPQQDDMVDRVNKEREILRRWKR